MAKKGVDQGAGIPEINAKSLKKSEKPTLCTWNNLWSVGEVIKSQSKFMAGTFTNVGMSTWIRFWRMIKKCFTKAKEAIKV